MRKAINVIPRILVCISSCTLASFLFLITVVFYGIAFFLALEQSTLMTTTLEKQEILLLIVLPSFTAILAFIIGPIVPSIRNNRCSKNARQDLYRTTTQ